MPSDVTFNASTCKNIGIMVNILKGINTINVKFQVFEKGFPVSTTISFTKFVQLQCPSV